jgi:3' terminal RNA ribose 2'-O-methyltransferase Hen1
MLLTITSTQPPATDLGYLLYKNPARAQTFELAFGKAHVFYPEASEERCTAALLLDIDPVGLVRGHGGAGEGFALRQYVNDRPYVASSFLSVAIANVFSSALSGKCKERPELAQAAIPLSVRIAALPCRGGEALLRRLFEPLGYAVAAAGHPLDERFPEWGASRYYTVTLDATRRLSEVLTHLYVLIPVLDDDKHYWVGDDEVDKLLRFGEGWLAQHPARDLIADRYLKHQRYLKRQALEQLIEEESPDAEESAESRAREEDVVEKRVGLNTQRIGAVVAALRQSGARRVLDLGCGEGQLIRALLADPAFEQITGMDVSYRALEMARERLELERMAPRQRQRVNLMQGSLLYRDARLASYDAAALVEVIEHLDPPRLAACERSVFEFARPGTVVVTTPNVEYNVKFEGLPGGRFRHRDHRFEWTRAQFQAWADGVAGRFGYRARFLPVGPEDAVVGAPTQMAIFVLEVTP